MFTDLHELTLAATLMIVVSNEGDQLRVSVTPTQAGDKTKPHPLRPLCLVATPAELDADFGAALLAWQAPKKSLIEQAQEAANASVDEDGSDAGPAAAAKSKSASKAEKGKPGPKKKTPVQTALAADDSEPKVGSTTPEFQLEPAPASTADGVESLEPEEPVAQPAPAPVVDTKTLNLF